MAYKIFVVNPGSTSTKIAVFNNEECAFKKSIRHDPAELSAFQADVDQYWYRVNVIKEILKENGFELDGFDAFVGRGGILRPLAGGTYRVNKQMLEDLRTSRYGNHASNLGALIVSELAAAHSKEAYVVNPPVVDELMEVARVTGLPEIKRTSVFHALNQKAVAIRAARDTGVDYNKSRFIVAHLGGGVSVGAHDMGRVTDVNNGLEEGPFTPQRTGSLPVIQLVDLCFSGKYTKAEINKLLVGKGGLYAHTGISDGVVLAEKAEKDSSVKLLFDAMAYRIAREICACAATLYGKVDRVIITGGLANDTVLVDKIKERVSFLGPVSVYPGEDEMSALAEGMMRVLEGHETVLEY